MRRQQQQQQQRQQKACNCCWFQSSTASRTVVLLLLIMCCCSSSSSSSGMVVVEAFTTTTTTKTNIIRSNQLIPSATVASVLLLIQSHRRPVIRSMQPVTRRFLSSSSSNSNADVEALLAAAAKAREEANRLSEELGKPVSSSTTTTASGGTTTSSTSSRVRRSVDDVKAMIPSILSETNIEQQKEQWELVLKESSGSGASNSASRSSSSRSSSVKQQPAFGSANLRTFPVSLEMLEQRTGMTAATLGLTDSDVSLDDFKYATLYVTGGSTVAAIASLAFLPPNVGATFCYGFALLPILFLGIGSTAPGFIAEGIAIIRGGDAVTSDGDSTTTTIVTKEERICRHEAAHFCCGYWCGLPIVNYNTIDVTTNNVARVEFDIGTSRQGGSSGYTSTDVAALTITAMAGLAGESMKYGSAKGATDDLMQLENTVFRQSQNFIGAAASQDLTRWGALTASLLLKQNVDAYEKVVAAFQRQASIDECIAILENLA